MKIVNIIRVLLNLIIFIPLIIISVSYYFWIGKNLMAELYGIVLFILIVPFINILIELIIIFKRKLKYSKSSILIILANIVIFFLDFYVAYIIGSKF